MTLAELIQVWREHRGAVTQDESQAAKKEVIVFLEEVRAYTE